MIDVFDGEIELVLVMLAVAAIFGAAAGQHALGLHTLLVEEGDERSFKRLAAVSGVFLS
jgi:hypothetical protein